MKQFEVAVQQITVNEDGEDTGAEVFTLSDEPDVEYTCYPPTEGQITLLMANTARHTSTQTKVAAVIDFMAGVLDEDSYIRIAERLNTRGPRLLKLDQIEEILEWMVEEWTGRPTQPSSASTSSRTNGGRKSTRRTSRPISSVSQPTGS